MEYQVFFDRKRLVVFMVGVFFAGVLTFCAGVIVGIGLWMPAKKDLAALQGRADAGKELAEKHVSDAKTAIEGARKKADETLAGVTAPLTTATVPAPNPPGTAAAATPPTTPGAPKPAANPASEPAPVNPAETPFVLQLGAFRDTKNAKQLQAELKQKGYPTRIYSLTDEDQKTWHMVRYGAFKDLNAAAEAATDLTGKEGIQAFVRRSDSL